MTNFKKSCKTLNLQLEPYGVWIFTWQDEVICLVAISFDLEPYMNHLSGSNLIILFDDQINHPITATIQIQSMPFIFLWACSNLESATIFQGIKVQLYVCQWFSALVQRQVI